MRNPSLGLSLLPLAFLMAMLAVNVAVFRDDASGGPNQLALLFAAAAAAALGHFVLRANYRELEHKALHSVVLAMQAMVILLVVGILIGLWIISGIVPTMVYYGLKLIHPNVFLLVACVVCSVVSITIGSSWSTMGTVGVALMAIGKTLGFPGPLVAGAIVSGAYFGDKMSPMSDTTNLAPAVAGTDLFTHIRNMLYTTTPSYTITLVLFAGIGIFFSVGDYDPGEVESVLHVIDREFSVGWHLLIPPLLVILLVGCRVPALPALLSGAVLGALTALVFQRHLLGDPFTWGSAYDRLVTTAHSGFVLESGNERLDALFSQGGMLNMLSTVLLITTAMLFGGMMEATGMLGRIARAILSLVRGTGTLVGATVGSCILCNIAAPDQYISIVVPGRMFSEAYRRRQLKPQNLSRALEDGGTVTSVLVPWNTCGAYATSVLGVNAFHFAPFAFFNLLSPVVSVFMASLGIGIKHMDPDDDTAETPPPEE